MIDKVIKKYNLDVDSMKREGTIACLTFLASWIFFGINNAILAYPIALTSSILLKENFKINPLEKNYKTFVFILFYSCFIIFSIKQLYIRNYNKLFHYIFYSL